MAQVFYGGGIIAAAPLLALVQVDRLSLSLAEVGTIGVVTAIAATVSCLIWGAVSDRVGGLAIIQVGTVLGALSLLVVAVAPSLAFLWVSAALIGLANAAMEMGWPGMLADHTTLDERAKVAAGLNALTGARGLVAPFLGSLLVQAGILDVTTTVLLCAGATGVGALLYLGMTPAGDPRPWMVRAATTAHEGLSAATGGLRRARSLVVGAGLRG
jgi:MFS family permease